MANIVINEISQNYTYNIGSSTYATVALPMTSCWGPGYADAEADGLATEEDIEKLVWNRFPANQDGLESFLSTYRGPISNFRLVQDYSYYQALTLLTAGYDVLTCRLSAGKQAHIDFDIVPEMHAEITPYERAINRANIISRSSSDSLLKGISVAGKTISGDIPTGGSSIDDAPELQIDVPYKTKETQIIAEIAPTAKLQYALKPDVSDVKEITTEIQADDVYPQVKQYGFATTKSKGDEVLSVKDCGDDTFYIIFNEKIGNHNKYLIDIDTDDHKYSTLFKGQKTHTKCYWRFGDSKDKTQIDFVDEEPAADFIGDWPKDDFKHGSNKQVKISVYEYTDADDTKYPVQLRQVYGLDGNTFRDIKIDLKDSDTDITLSAPVAAAAVEETWEYAIDIDATKEADETCWLKITKGDKSQVYKVVVNVLPVPAKQLHVYAKYPGSFGNKLRIVLQKVTHYNRWNIIVYVIDDSGVQQAVENLTFVMELDNSTETILHLDELDSNFITLKADPGIKDTVDFVGEAKRLVGGSDFNAGDDAGNAEALMTRAIALAKSRYQASGIDAEEIDNIDYILDLTRIRSELTAEEDDQRALALLIKEWCYTSAYQVFDTLEDKLAYNPARIMVPGWDDQDFMFINNDDTSRDIRTVSPLHAKLMEVAYFSRCATAYLDIPRSLSRAYVYDDSETNPGYAQRLSRIQSETTNFDLNTAYYPSHSALFAPWGRYNYAGVSKQYQASPSFLALMIERAMILNQTSQYEWQLPTTRRHNLRIGKLDYNISKKYLDVWQSLEGVGINCITNIPELGVSIWGNSTLFEVPPATYQALANLSTRKLVNAVEDLSYKCGISITFNYNNDQAYNAFYAGLTPLLDSMRNAGAIEDYYLRMSEDVNGLDSVNANSVIGKIYLVIDGVINDISIDLIALPPQTDLDQYRS